MATLQPFEYARIVRLVAPDGDYDGWRVNQRAPAIGDIGTVLDILTAPDMPNKYVVEASAEDGITIWLADFFAEELQAIEPDAYRPQSAAPRSRDDE